MGSSALPSESAVVKELYALLQDADLQKTTERSLQNALATHFGVPMQGYAELIKKEVANFISEQAGKWDSQSSKRPRDEDASGDVVDDNRASRTSKAARSGERDTTSSSRLGSTEGVLSDHALSADGKTRAQVKKFKGATYVDLRQYWEKDARLLPSKKGIMLPLGEWQLVESNLSAARAALQQSDLAFEVPLSGSRRISVNEFKSKIYAGIREWYDDGGEMKPGKNGINLDAPMLENLIQCAPSLTSAAGPLPAAKAPAAAASAASAPSSNQASTSGAAKAAAKTAVKAGAANKAGEPAELESGTGDTIFQLGGTKFASVSQFKGQWMVGLREYYQKDGAWMPGKKGISLGLDQFQTLCNHEQDVSAALQAKDETFSEDLSTARKVSISTFKGTQYVNIREYYSKDGKMLPGSKGIALNREQWNAFTSVLDTLKERTECAW